MKNDEDKDKKKNKNNTSTRQEYTDQYDFVPLYRVEMLESHLINNKFDINKFDIGGENVNADKDLKELMESGKIKTSVNN
jgi:hypothetical protein